MKEDNGEDNGFEEAGDDQRFLEDFETYLIGSLDAPPGNQLSARRGPILQVLEIATVLGFVFGLGELFGLAMTSLAFGKNILHLNKQVVSVCGNETSSDWTARRRTTVTTKATVGKVIPTEGE